MVRVVDAGPHKSVVKKAICKMCGATLEYAPLDVKEDHTTDYDGSREYYKYIACPQCNALIVVK